VSTSARTAGRPSRGGARTARAGGRRNTRSGSRRNTRSGGRGR
jgi:hypothetical protein